MLLLLLMSSQLLLIVAKEERSSLSSLKVGRRRKRRVFVHNYNNRNNRRILQNQQHQNSQYCGGGSVNNGLCADSSLCCSPYGWCGRDEAWCNDDNGNLVPSPTIAPQHTTTNNYCGYGFIGNGICQDRTLCCSEFGWCGLSDAHCTDDGTDPTPSPVGNPTPSPVVVVNPTPSPVLPTPSPIEVTPSPTPRATIETVLPPTTAPNNPTPSPIPPPTPSPISSTTYAPDTTWCGRGVVGNGICEDTTQCCSSYGYCGTTEYHCNGLPKWTGSPVPTRPEEEEEEESEEESADNDDESTIVGTCDNGNVGNGICPDDPYVKCCSIHGWCGYTDAHCNNRAPVLVTTTTTLRPTINTVIAPEEEPTPSPVVDDPTPAPVIDDPTPSPVNPTPSPVNPTPSPVRRPRGDDDDDDDDDDDRGPTPSPVTPPTRLPTEFIFRPRGISSPTTTTISPYPTTHIHNRPTLEPTKTSNPVTTTTTATIRSFHSTTTNTAINESSSVFVSSRNNIQPLTPEPTPYPTPQITPEPTPIPTPNPTPDPTPVPTKNPTYHDDEPNPTPGPSPIPTPYPTPPPPRVDTTIVSGSSSSGDDISSSCQISVDSTTYAIGQTIVVTYNFNDAYVNDWIGIYPCDAGVPDNKYYHSIVWQWSCGGGSNSCTTPSYRGTIVFVELPIYNNSGPHTWPIDPYDTNDDDDDNTTNNHCYKVVYLRHDSITSHHVVPPYDAICESNHFTIY